MVQRLAMPPQSKKVASLIAGLRPFCVEFACLLCVCEGPLQVLWFPRTVQKHACEVNWRLSIGPRWMTFACKRMQAESLS